MLFALNVVNVGGKLLCSLIDSKYEHPILYAERSRVVIPNLSIGL